MSNTVDIVLVKSSDADWQGEANHPERCNRWCRRGVSKRTLVVSIKSCRA